MGHFRGRQYQPGDQVLILGRASSAAYVGPGDLTGWVAPFAFYSVFAMTAAIAVSGTQKCMQVTRASDSATLDLFITSGGLMDVAAAAAFQGASTLTVTIWYD